MKTEIDAVCAANQGFYRGIPTCKKRGRSALVGRFVRMGDRLSNLLRRLPKAGRLRELV